MSGKSLGLIETVGMSAAVEAADAAMKSANVSLVGYELTKGRRDGDREAGRGSGRN